jgi:hypothetical protein
MLLLAASHVTHLADWPWEPLAPMQARAGGSPMPGVPRPYLMIETGIAPAHGKRIIVVSPDWWSFSCHGNVRCFPNLERPSPRLWLPLLGRPLPSSAAGRTSPRLTQLVDVPAGSK